MIHGYHIVSQPHSRLEHQNGCIKSYRPDMRTSSDPESAHQIGLDEYMVRLEEVTWPSLGVQIDLAAAWVTGQLCRFCVQIQNLLKNKYRCKLDHPKWSWSYFPSFTDLAISGATMEFKFPCQILNLLKNKSRYKLDCPKQSSFIFADFVQLSLI